MLLSKGFGVLGFGVDFGNEDGGFRGKVIGERFPDGSKRLAVCT